MRRYVKKLLPVNAEILDFHSNEILMSSPFLQNYNVTDAYI